MDHTPSAQNPEAVLRRLMEQYELPIRRMCCVYLHDEHLAADAVQETFLRAYRSLGSFRSECSEKTWLMRIAVNVCRSMYRRSWMRHEDRQITLDQLPEPACSADYGLIELTLEVMRLPRHLLEAVLLHDYQGLTVRETGKLLGIPHQTVISRLRRAHQLLRITLKGGADE